MMLLHIPVMPMGIRRLIMATYSYGYAPLYSYYGGGPFWGYRPWQRWNHW
jgi:hypothetical protein